MSLFAYQAAWRDDNDWAEIPDGHDVHHICRVPICINSKHLEMLSELEHHQRHHPDGPKPEAVYNSNRTITR